jgi:hypothetical protein
MGRSERSTDACTAGAAQRQCVATQPWGGGDQHRQSPALPAHELAHLRRHEVVVLDRDGVRRMKAAWWKKTHPLARWHAIAEQEVG